VNAEFDRVAKALKSAAGKLAERDREDTQAIIAILEEKRAEVMASTQAGCFAHDWQELSDQVRQTIGKDPRHLAIKDNRKARQRNLRLAESPPAVHSKGVDPKAAHWIEAALIVSRLLRPWVSVHASAED
jgi:hypothetical protein